MKVLIIGGDGYLGWPQAMYLSRRGHDVAVVDNFSHRTWDLECGTESLVPIYTLHERIACWADLSGRMIGMHIGDVTDGEFVDEVMRRFRPEAIVHYGEQPGAPYSMIDRKHSVYTQVNNIVGTLNLIYAMKEHCPDSHLIKLGSMGEYGTPGIDIEEGFIEINHNGRKDVLPFPKQPGSFYHLSKVHDSHNIAFACKIWGLRSTDLNQGVVYGVDTDEIRMHERLATRFDYDGFWGTVLNRYCVQAIIGHPLTVYGRGGQTRGFLNIRDTMRCVELAILNPPRAGEYRVFNQFTEQFTVSQLAQLVANVAAHKGIQVEIGNIPAPRVESEIHYYNAKRDKLLQLGLEPHFLSDALIESMFDKLARYQDRVRRETIMPLVDWRKTRNPSTYGASTREHPAGVSGQYNGLGELSERMENEGKERGEDPKFINGVRALAVKPCERSS
jgi:UDP-sulfoquinovose synthase